MNAQKLVQRAMKENPEIALILEVAHRARELEERAMQESPVPAIIGTNPVASQGVASSGHILKYK
jgi:hypothetical protein